MKRVVRIMVWICMIGFIIILHNQRQSPIVIDETKIESVVIRHIKDQKIQKKEITDQAKIQHICNGMNSLDVKRVNEKYMPNFVLEKGRNHIVYYLCFRMRNGAKKHYTYCVGEYITYNGKIYKTFNENLEQFLEMES